MSTNSHEWMDLIYTLMGQTIKTIHETSGNISAVMEYPVILKDDCEHKFWYNNGGMVVLKRVLIL